MIDESLIVPRSDGRLGEIICGGLDETAALPFEEDEGLDRLELVMGLGEEE